MDSIKINFQKIASYSACLLPAFFLAIVSCSNFSRNNPYEIIWSPANNGLSGDGLMINALVANGTTIFAGTVNGIYRSIDSGASWTGPSLPTWDVACMLVNGSNILAGTIENGIYISSDNGFSWTGTSGIPSGINTLSFAANNSYLFAGTNGGVFRSSISGTNWTAVTSTSISYPAVTVSGSTLIAGSNNNGAYISSDNGLNWAPSNIGLPSYCWVNYLAVIGSTYYLNTQGATYKSTNGTTWAKSGLPNRLVSLKVCSGYLVAISQEDGVFISKNNGTSWASINTELQDLYVTSVDAIGSQLFVGTLEGVSISQLP
jgi:hypothetical protein